MSTKVANPRPIEAGAGPTEDLRAAYQAHTLVQMLYGQMAMSQPWPVYPQYYAGPLSGYEPSPVVRATPWAASERCGCAWNVPVWYR